MRIAHCRTWNMAINLENETNMRNTQGRTWNMARNIEMRKMETHTVGP